MTLYSAIELVTLSTSNLALDLAPVQVTSNYKLVAYSTAPSSLKYEVLLDITWEHPCRSATFSDPSLVSMASFVRSGVRITQAVAPFTVPSSLDCGTQTIEIVDQPFATYSLSDFLTYSAATSDISLSPLLDDHEGVYNVNLKVTFSTHLVTHTTAAPFQVTVLPPCDLAVINLAWVGVTSPHTYQIGSPAVDFSYTAPLDSAYSHCTGVVELQE